jgi:hypothetical protein
MSDEAKEVKEGIEVPEITEAEPTAFATHGLLPQEVEMAKEHGLVEEESKEVDESSKEEEKKDDEHEEQPEAKTEDNKEEEKPKTFEEVEKNEGGLKKFNPNEQALYWKWKSDKKKKQAAVRDLEEYKANTELSSIKEKSKLSKIAEALSSENVTVEALQAIIGNAEKGDLTPLTKADLKQIESEKALEVKEETKNTQQHAERLKLAEDIGKTKYDNFDELTKLATEVVNSDKTGTYKDVLDASFKDTEIDEEELIERVVTIAKLNPNFGKKKSDSAEDAPTETDVDRAIKNSKKKVSSASLGSGGGKRTVSHDDLTADDAAKMTTSQYMKLPNSVRKRLLGG